MTAYGYLHRRYLFLQRLHSVLDTASIAGCISGPRRSKRSLLPEWQIASQYGEAGFGESIGQGDQERSLRVRSRSVCEHQAFFRVRTGQVQKSAYCWIAAFIQKSFKRWRTHGSLERNLVERFVHFDGVDLVS